MRLSKVLTVASVALAVVALTGCTSASKRAAPKATHTAAAPAPTPQITVEDVTGDSYYLAREEIAGQFLHSKLDVANVDVDVDSKDYEVVSETPAAGTVVDEGTTITLHVKPIEVHVPDVTGKTYADAKKAIDAAEGNLHTAASDDDADDDWTVKSQSPSAGKTVRAGTTVTLHLASPRIVFKVTGNGSASDVITYTIPGTSNIEQATNAHLPWSKSFPDDGGELAPNGYVSAQDEDGTSITCEISESGRVIDKHTATGQYAIVQCGG